MKKIIILLFLWNSCYSQGIFVPVNPTVYGSNNQRVKAILALLIPNKDTSLNTNDTTGTSQIFYRPADSTFWGWSHNTGYVKLSGGGKGNDTAFVALMQALDSSYALFVHSDRSIPADTFVVVGVGGSSGTDFRPYKVYSAIIDQSGTSNPTATVLENTTGATVSFSRSFAGTYGMTFSSPVLIDLKTAILTSNNNNASPAYIMIAQRNSTTNISIWSRKTSDGTDADGELGDFIEVRIYN